MYCSRLGLKKNFCADLLTVVATWMGFSIVFPIFAPLLFSADALYFSYSDSQIFKTSVLGVLYGIYGVGQGIGFVLLSFWSQSLGKRGGLILLTFLMLMGYLVMALGIYQEYLVPLFAGRLFTGIGSAAILLSQRAVQDLVDPTAKKEGGKFFFTAGALAFISAPWIGGNLSRLNWIQGAGGFIFGALFSFIHLLILFLFYEENTANSPSPINKTPVYCLFPFFAQKNLMKQKLVWVLLLFFLGFMSFILSISPFIAENFGATPQILGDFFAYILVLFILGIFLLSPLIATFNVRLMSYLGILLGALGIFITSLTTLYWTFWMTIPLVIFSSLVGFQGLMASALNEELEAKNGSALYPYLPIIASGSLTIAAFVLGPLIALESPLPLAVGSCFYLLAFLLDAITFTRG